MPDTSIVCPMCGTEFSVSAELSIDGATCPHCGVEVLESAELQETSNPLDPARLTAETGNSLGAEIPLSVESDEGAVSRPQNNPRLAAIIAGCAVLASIVGIVIAFLTAGLSHVMRYMPDNMTMMMSLEYTASDDSIIVEAIKEELPYTQSGKGELDEFIGIFTGLSAEGVNQVDRLYFGASPDLSVVGYFEFNQDISSDRILEWCDNVDYESFEINGTEAFKNDLVAFCVVDNRAAVFASPRSLKRVIRRDGQPEISREMKAALANADMARSVCGAVHLRKKQTNRSRTIPAGFSSYFEVIDRAKFVVISADIGETLNVEMTVGCKDEDDAVKLGSSFEEGLARLAGTMPDTLGDVGKEVMNTIEVSREAKLVTVRLTIDVELVEKLGEKYREFESSDTSTFWPLKP